MLQKHKLFAIALTAILHAALYLLAFEHFASLLDRSSKRISEPTVLIALDLEREPPVQPIKAEPILTETRQAIPDDQRALWRPRQHPLHRIGSLHQITQIRTARDTATSGASRCAA